LWRGDAYSEFAHEEWAAGESRRLAELRAGATEDLVELLLGAGEWTMAIATIESLIDREPFRDRPRGLLMRALADSGRRIDALRAFQTYRTFLVDEIGTEPSALLVALDREIARRGASEAQLPSGTVAFLFVDVEESTRLWVADPDAMSASLHRYDAVVRQAIESRGGYVSATAGDGIAAAFHHVSDATDAAVAAQRVLDGMDWCNGSPLRARMGIHVGAAEKRGGVYVGSPVNIAARVADAGHGGQVVATDAALSAAGIEGIDLGEHRLRDVEEPVRLLQLGAGDFPPLRTVSVGMVSVPSPRTSLVGREAEVIEVRKLVAAHRLVTLTGVGGCGKTRLAIEIAARDAPRRADGAWFVDLVSVGEGTAVAGAVAAALDLVTDASSSMADQIAAYLAPRDALLIVDNCEHRLSDVAELLDVLLDRAQRLRILTTSRQALEVDGEYTWRVPSLELGLRSASVRLFVERAAAVLGAFDPDDPTTEIIAEICDELDGIPLAIELAAARVRTMGVGEIRDRLDDRFNLLSGGGRRSRRRHQTLEAAVQWSYDLLSADEQVMLAGLSVFHGGFDVADVAAVAAMGRADAVDLADALVAKSLIDVTRTGELVRHRLLETIRLFALQRLVESGTAEVTRDRHLEHFLADPAVRDLGHAHEIAGGLRIQREIENLRAGASWAIERGRPAAAAVIASALQDQLMLRGETHQILAWLQDDPELDRAERVRCLGSAGWTRAQTFDLTGGLDSVTRAIEAAADEPVDYLPLAHCQAAKINMMRRDVDAGNDHLERGLRVAERTSCPAVGIATILISRSSVYANLGAFAASADAAAQALATAPETFTLRAFAVDLRDLAMFFDGRDPPTPRRCRDDSSAGPLRLSWGFTSAIVDAVIACRADGPDAAAARLADGA
ncbi:MAG: AfsR/SARP family transcriptional regulator, partial [Actinomycetota bacterium]